MADPTTSGDTVEVSTLDPEDAKIVTLARSARARTGAAQGAAVRDADGRTYNACSVSLPSLRLSALQAAVAAAVSAGAPGLEAAAVVGSDAEPADPSDPGVTAVADVTASAVVVLADAAGARAVVLGGGA